VHRLAPVLVVLAVLAGRASATENIDPASDEHQYAWGENIGWVNAEPSGEAGPGAEVQDFRILGWLWGENVGWINLHCLNNGTCADSSYGVLNDAYGALSGFAWAENIGWINFAPTTCLSDPTCGVHIDAATGYFLGRAWSENGGWISFSTGGPPSEWTARTSWCQSTGSAPGFGPALSVEKTGGGGTTVIWSPQSNATWYDVVSGRLSTLRATQGDFALSTDRCFASKLEGTAAPIPGPPPPAGDGSWFLARGANCRGRGSYDSGAASQVGSRDTEIAASPFACP
jgi:hypothetical protein